MTISLGIRGGLFAAVAGICSGRMGVGYLDCPSECACQPARGTVTHRIVAVVLFVAVLAAAGCDVFDSADRDALIAGFDAAVEAVDATDVDGPNETTSKDLTYITGSGLTDDVETALERAISGLLADGMEVGDSTPVEHGAVVAAHDDTIAVRISVFPKAGIVEAPEGMSIVQISVAPADAGLAWTPE